MVVCQASVGAGSQQCSDGCRATVSDGSVQGRHSAEGAGVGVGARLNEVFNDCPLPRGIPVGRAWDAGDG
jgi:hypothetical protein